jgi:hypothetical protein
MKAFFRVCVGVFLVLLLFYVLLPDTVVDAAPFGLSPDAAITEAPIPPPLPPGPPPPKPPEVLAA